MTAHPPLLFLSLPRRCGSPSAPPRITAATPLPGRIGGHDEVRRRALHLLAADRVPGRRGHAGNIAAVPRFPPPRPWSLSLTVRLIVGQPAPLARQDSAGNLHAILPEEVQALPGAGALLHPAALSAIAGSAKRLLELAGASPGADVGVLSRAMEELERLAAGGTAMGRAELSTSTAADMDIDAGGSNKQGDGTRGRDPGTKRKREARRGGDDVPGMSQRPAKRQILAWRVRQYWSLVAKAAKVKATARKARSRRAQVRPMRRKTGSWKSVEQQLARATLSDGLHRWSPGGGGGPADQ